MKICLAVFVSLAEVGALQDFGEQLYVGTHCIHL